MNEYDIEKAFQAIENELITSMMRNMKRHRLEEISEEKEWSMWQSEQLKSLEQYKRNNQKVFSSRFSNINGSISGLLQQAREQGNMQQEIQILNAIKNGWKPTKALKNSNKTIAAFFRINDRKLEALIKATTDDMKKAETAILRMANDQYRQVIFNAQIYANTGAGTYEKAVDMATKDFLNKGLNCVEYANGARHTLADYAYMAIQTASKRAYLAGEGEKRKEWGIATVIMNKRGNACPLCLPFVGKVLIDDVWSGGVTDGKHMLMSTAISKGLYHPRCKDSHTTYFPGISSEGASYTKNDIRKIEDDYRAEQQQKYIARMVRKYENLKEGSLDPDNIVKYDNKLKEWKNRLKGIDNPGNDAIINSKRNGADRAREYQEHWEKASLKKQIAKYLKNPKADGVNSKGKINYSSEESPIQIVYDINGDYFRLQDTSMKGKKNYLDINGKPAFNTTENGKTRGRTNSEFQVATHFKNSDKE